MKAITRLGLICCLLHFLAGCSAWNKEFVKSIVYEELHDSILPIPQDGTPRCVFSATIAFFDSYNDKARALNAQIANCILGTDGNVTHMGPQKAVEKFRDDFFQLYNDEVAPLVQSDFADGMPVAEMPEWYSIARNVKTRLFCGRDSVVCYELGIADDRGGAHPSTYLFWYNFDMRNATLITPANYLDVNAAGLKTLLEEELVKVVAEKTDDEIANMDELKKEYGIPYGDSLYIPENFMLKESCVSFLFNRYEIAPYALGDIQLEIPYDKIKPYLRKQD